MKPTDQDLQSLSGLRSRFTMRPERRDALERRILQQHKEQAALTEDAPASGRTHRTSLHIAETVLAACLAAALAFGYFAVLRRLPHADTRSGESSESVTSVSAEITETVTTTESTAAATDSVPDTHTDTETEPAQTTTAAPDTTRRTDAAAITASTESTGATISTTNAPASVTESTKPSETALTSATTEHSTSVSESELTAITVPTALTTPERTTESPRTTVSGEQPLADQLLLTVSGGAVRPGETVHIRVTVQKPVCHAGVQLFWQYHGTLGAPAPIIKNGTSGISDALQTEPSVNFNGPNGILSAVWSTADGLDAIIPAGTVLMEFDLTVPESAAPGTVYTPVLGSACCLIRQNLTQQYAVAFADAGTVTVTE